MSCNTPVSSRLLAPTKSFSAHSKTTIRTPISKASTLTSKTPGPHKINFNPAPTKYETTPRIQRGTAVKTPLVTDYKTPSIGQKLRIRALPMTVGRPMNSSTLKRDKPNFNTPSSKLNNPTALKSKTVDNARLVSVRRSILTLQNPLNSVKTPPEVKTPASKLFRKIFASGNSGTKIPIRKEHFTELKKETTTEQQLQTPVNKNIERVKSSKRRSSVRRSSGAFTGLDDEACLLITPSLMRRLICSASKFGNRTPIKKSDNEEPVKVHSVKPSSLLNYLFKSSSSNKEDTPAKEIVQTIVSSETEVSEKKACKSLFASGIFKTQELACEKTSSCAQKVFGNTDDVSQRPISLFSQAVSCKEPAVVAERLVSLEAPKQEVAEEKSSGKNLV